MLMKKGNIVYQGAAARATKFFEAQGYPCPPMTNPADFLIDVITDDSLNGQKNTDIDDDEDGDVYNRLHYDDNGKKFLVPVDHSLGAMKEKWALKEWQPWWVQFFILLRRNFLFHTRQYEILVTNIGVTIIVSLFCSLSCWYQIGE